MCGGMNQDRGRNKLLRVHSVQDASAVKRWLVWCKAGCMPDPENEVLDTEDLFLDVSWGRDFATTELGRMGKR